MAPHEKIIQFNRHIRKESLMYILTLFQDGRDTQLGIFDSIQEGRQVLAQIEGYYLEEGDLDGEEYILPEALPLYTELHHRGHRIPLSRFMFPHASRIQVFWPALPYLSQEGQGLVDGSSRVDAYQVNNDEVQAYIQDREAKYQAVAQALQAKGYQVRRDFLGSEDGEALLYQGPGQADWHILHHLDPTLFDLELSEILDWLD